VRRLSIEEISTRAFSKRRRSLQLFIKGEVYARAKVPRVSKLRVEDGALRLKLRANS